MKTSVCMLAAVAGLAAASQAAVVNLSLIKTIDTTSTATAGNAQYVGTNVSGIAWNGTDLWVGGACNALYQWPQPGVSAVLNLSGLQPLVAQWRHTH